MTYIVSYTGSIYYSYIDNLNVNNTKCTNLIVILWR